MSDWREDPIRDLELSVRSFNTLTAGGIVTCGELYDLFRSSSKPQILKRFPGFGMKSYHEVNSIVSTWYHRMRVPEPVPVPAPHIRNMYRVTFVMQWYSDDELKTGEDSMLVETWSADKAREIAEVGHGKKVTDVKLVVEDV